MYPSSRKGFTIIELLVAIGVTALLVTLMINIVTTVLTNWNRTSGTLSTGNQARLVLDQISQDLQGAILKNTSDVWMAASVQTAEPVTGVASQSWPATGKPAADLADTDINDSVRLSPAGLNLTDYRFGLAGVWLRFLTIPSGLNTAGDPTTISAPRAVAYQIIRKKVGSTAATNTQFSYQLFRSEVYPDATFTAGYNLYQTGGYNSPTATSVGAVANLRSPNVDQVIANGVVDFGVRLFALDSTTGKNAEVFPVDRRGGGAVGSYAFAATTAKNLTDPGTGLTVANTTPAFPTVAEIMIRVITPEGVRLLDAKENGNPVPGTWWEIVIQNSNVYTRRIDLKATAL